MLFKLSDGKTLIAFHHNRSKFKPLTLPETDLSITTAPKYGSPSLWTEDVDEPQFVFATALEPFFDNIWRDFNTSYLDAFIDDGVINLFCPHRWERVLYLKIMEKICISFQQEQFLN